VDFTTHKADKRHLSAINRLIVETRIGDPMDKLHGTFWFARVNGEIVGCAGVELIGNNAAVINYVAVRAGFRKKGIGMTLLGKVMGFARQQGVNLIGLVTMYYLFNRFKKRGFRTCPRKELPKALMDHWMFTAQRYMKCAAMFRRYGK